MDVLATGEISAFKENIQNFKHEILPFFLFLSVNFALLDPDPVDQNQFDSGSATLVMPLAKLKETDVSLVTMIYVENCSEKSPRENNVSKHPCPLFLDVICQNFLKHGQP
jgi:hypothetical protein